ncbi:MAG: hypothetical protein VX278_00380 [Myxococcota bacterium]|nr:hypothetical protein [Myxococcota bacterium]
MIPPPLHLLKEHPYREDCTRIFHQACAYWLRMKTPIPFGIILMRDRRIKTVTYPKRNPKEPVIEWLQQTFQNTSRGRAFGVCYRADIQAKVPMTVLRVIVQHKKGGKPLVFYVPESAPERWWIEEGSAFLWGKSP